MKNIFLLIIIIASAFAEAYSEMPLLYKTKSGMVEYKISGLSEGTEVLYFDNYGLLESRKTTTKTTIMGFSAESKSLNIRDKEWSYSINLDEKTGTKTKNEDVEKFAKDMVKSNNLEDKADEIIKALGGKKLGDEMFMGRMCEVWEFTRISSKGWYYKMVPLKLEVSLMGTITYTATKFEEGVSVPAEKYSIPKGIKIEEVDMSKTPKNMEDMFKMMQESEEHDGEEEND